jgi:hypothetical protein
VILYSTHSWEAHHKHAPHLEIHVIPNIDLFPHALDVTCWCEPTEDDDDPDYWRHHSADGREPYEEGLKLKH